MSTLAEDAVAAPPINPTGWLAYNNSAARVVLKPGAIAEMGGEVDALGCRRLLLVSGPHTRASRLFAKVRDALGERVVGVFEEVVEHSATTLVTQGAEQARSLSIDGIVAVGGGSASDTAKGIAILLAEGGRIEEHASTFIPPDRFFPKDLPSPKLPVIAVPTTGSAAEVTPGLGIRDEAGKKLLFWDVKLASRLIILDPEANVEVPADLLARTSMNGLAHCVEGLYSRLRNPISEALALQGIRLFMDALPQLPGKPGDVEIRGRILAAAHLSGMVISNARVGIHHAVCHCLGALGGLSHGTANSVMLPYAMAYNLPVAAAPLALMARFMGIDTASLSERQAAEAAIQAVRDLQAAAGVPARLRETDLDKALLPRIAEHTMGDRGLFFNPRRTERVEAVLQLLEEAW